MNLLPTITTDMSLGRPFMQVNKFMIMTELEHYICGMSL